VLSEGLADMGVLESGELSDQCENVQASLYVIRIQLAGYEGLLNFHLVSEGSEFQPILSPIHGKPEKGIAPGTKWLKILWISQRACGPVRAISRFYFLTGLHRKTTLIPINHVITSFSELVVAISYSSDV
jgi:hypothetical protein